MKKTVLATLVVALLGGCSSVRNPPGPKVYDNINIIVSTDDALLPVPVDKEFLRILRTRVKEFAEDRVRSKSDLKIASECGPRTMQVTIDFVSIQIDNETSASLLNPFKATAKKTDVIRIAANTIVKDCATSAVILKNSDSEDEKDLSEILHKVAESSMDDAFDAQRGKK